MKDIKQNALLNSDAAQNNVWFLLKIVENKL